MSQLKSLQQLTNVNSIATSLEDSTIRNLMPNGSTNVTALLTGNFSQLGTLGTQAQQIQSGYAIATSGNSSVDQIYNKLLQQTTAGAATQSAFGASTLNIAQQRTTGLEQLRTALDTAQDPKQVMDLSARIAVEQAHMQNDMMKLQAMKMSQEAQSAATNGATATSAAAAASATYQGNILRSGQ